MADDDKGEAAAAEEITDLDWEVRMREVQRIEPDAEDDGPEDLFSVTFAVEGPNANAEVEVMVTDVADIEVVAVALDTLHGALTAWADLIQRRKEDLRTILSED
ncbi:hypothetical protein D3273_21525 [Lichenibacterium minor]|uniref:Uncharacterized protein n=1 Tax=Lichenibacterium minor TaxID=2316528 RepID=A0A4Q2U4Y2_9HYPH|nr:hypothetical protein [Lichenibacterium minor]RYC29865.1 hypothetical protein D3273_21525 [Lichenibacterium minor]